MNGLYEQIKSDNYTKVKTFTRKQLEDTINKLFGVKLPTIYKYHKKFLGLTLKLIGI